MTYSVWEILFFANDRLIESGLSKEDAEKLKKECDDGNGDNTYRWYEIKPDKNE